MGLRGDLRRATALADEGRAVSEANGYPFGVAYALYYGGIVAKFRGDLEAAAAMFNEAAVRWRQLGESNWVALTLNNLAGVALAGGTSRAPAPSRRRG